MSTRHNIRQINYWTLGGFEGKKPVAQALEEAAAMGLGDRAALYHLKHFTELGLLSRSGTGPSTRYKVVSV